jgi:hypothetical protein
MFSGGDCGGARSHERIEHDCGDGFGVAFASGFPSNDFVLEVFGPTERDSSGSSFLIDASLSLLNAFFVVVFSRESPLNDWGPGGSTLGTDSLCRCRRFNHRGYEPDGIGGEVLP